MFAHSSIHSPRDNVGSANRNRLDCYRCEETTVSLVSKVSDGYHQRDDDLIREVSYSPRHQRDSGLQAVCTWRLVPLMNSSVA